MHIARHSARFTLLVLAVAAAFLAATGCGSGGEPDDYRREHELILGLARDQASQAAAALLEGDREGFLSRFPMVEADAAKAGDDLGDVFDTLAGLPWRSFSLDVTTVDPGRRLYRIRGTGRLGDAGPADRIAVVRYLEFALAPGDPPGTGDGVAVVRDQTPEELRDRYLMGLHDPLALQRRGLIVLGERRARARAQVVLAAAGRARLRLEDLGVDTSPTTVITVYGSAASVRDSLGVGASTSRLVFFAHPPLRVADEDWPVYDVGVMGPWLRDVGSALDGVLRHELAHAYTMRWFGDDESPPALLVEGIAQAAEGVSVTTALREEVETGDQLWPLPGSLGEADLWAGGDGQTVRLGYQVGGALIAYVVSEWGAAELRSFVQAVAAAEPTEAGMDEALRGCLGVGWREFFDGWRRYVLAGG